MTDRDTEWKWTLGLIAGFSAIMLLAMAKLAGMV